MRRTVIILVSLAAITLLVYWPLGWCGFINFDDPLYVTNNPHVFHGLSWESLRWAFTTLHSANWHPLTWLSHMLDCQIFGDRPAAHHFVNLFFHIGNTLLLFCLLKTLTGSHWPSAMVAALFAVHPLHVESVAWIAERKDVLSTFFGLLSLLAYVGFARRSRAEPAASDVSRFTFHVSRFTHHASFYYCSALALFVLALLSKPMLVTLPFILLLLDFWPLRRIAECSPIRRLVLEKLPFFLLALASCVVTIIAQSKGGAVMSEEMIPFRFRVLNAIVAYAAYLVKMVWPHNLAVFYPHPLEWPAWIVAGSVLLLAGISWVVLRGGGLRPYLIVGWLWYLGMLAPVIGFVQVGSQAMADRYTYVPLVGIFIMIVWGATGLTSRWPERKPVLGLAGGLVIGAYAITANYQVRYWQDSLTLFQHALQVAPENALAERNFGQALSLWGRQDEAIIHFEKALEIKPDFAMAQLNLGDSLNLLGRLDGAIAHYQKALELNPEYETAHFHLANVLVLKGRLADAEAHFQAALRYKPDYAEAHTKLANLLILQGRTAEAMPHYYAAIKDNPDSEEGYYYLATALARQNNLARAAAYLRTAIKLKPDDPMALNDLAWILATADDSKIRNPGEAISFAERACELTREENPKCLDTLAVAYSEARRFPEAIATTRRAVAAAESAGQKKMAALIQSRLPLYEQGHSFGQSSNSPPPGKR